jgi:hypothetical protein
MLSDWYHEQMGGPQGLLNYYLGPGGARGTFQFHITMLTREHLS